MVKSHPPVHPPTLKVTSCQRPVLEGVTATQTMSIRPKNNPRSRPTRQRETSANCKRCMRSRTDGSTPSSDQRFFSPTPKSSKFRSLLMPRSTRPKTSKTMAPRRRSAPSHPCLTRPWETHWPHQQILCHAPTSRSETPLSKQARETSCMSAS